jgi:hypothetical protein
VTEKTQSKKEPFDPFAVGPDEVATGATEPQVQSEAEPMPEPDDRGAESPSREYVEYVGTGIVDSPEFVSARTISRKDAKRGWDLTMAKDLEWTRAEGGVNKGRMLVSTEGLDPAVVRALESEPGFKVVTLND